MQRHFLLSLIHQTESLQESRWLGILHGLDLCLCILLAPHLRSGIFHDLCSGISRGPDLLLHGPDLCLGILYRLCLGILFGP